MGKGKGKERASDVGIRARQTQNRSTEVDSLSQRVGRRDRKPTAKAVEARESIGVQDVLEPSSSGIDGYGGASSSKVGKKSESKLFKTSKVNKQPKTKGARKLGMNVEKEYCHQCRCINNYGKMQCRGLRDNGEPCLLLFCEKCVLKR